MATYAEGYIQRRIDDDTPLDKTSLSAIRRDVIGILGHIRIDLMKVDDVEAFARQLAARGPSAKRTGVVQLKAILNEAIARDRIVKSAARSVKTPKSGERTRRLREDELQRYLEASREIGGPQGALLELYPRLVKRKDEEIAKMTWDQIDLVRNEWFIPHENSKIDQPYIVELPRQVRDIILQQQPDPKLRRGYVFTLNEGRTPPVMGTDVKNRLDALMHRRLELANKRDGTALGMDHFTLYDIRTTAVSRMEEAPFMVQPSVLDAVLLHKKGGRNSTKIYARAKLGSEAGEAIQRWNDHLDEMMVRRDAWPGGRTLDKMTPKERMSRLDALRANWPMREDQKKARQYLDAEGIDTAEYRRRQRRARAAANGKD